MKAMKNIKRSWLIRA